MIDDCDAALNPNEFRYSLCVEYLIIITFMYDYKSQTPAQMCTNPFVSFALALSFSLSLLLPLCASLCSIILDAASRCLSAIVPKQSKDTHI